ncbi:hypothetical protein E2562_008752 [Oryza meyeriana var. granulata]|uniref:Uncharacterized protein n=1 Tax=Oryza meyeriana var. granulata TaxID=110450 RepID=A0A6G1CZY1_9ORYZ|nr:hypothetical protein E2562_008752 [Oryza meyeriana var. granulata]
MPEETLGRRRLRPWRVEVRVVQVREGEPGRYGGAKEGPAVSKDAKASRHESVSLLDKVESFFMKELKNV